jgi:glycogen phosphorylase
MHPSATKTLLTDSDASAPSSGTGPISEPPSSLPTVPGVRAGMSPAEFKRSVIDHLLYTCAKEVPDASGFDFYQALAHAVRDRLIQRWVATRNTYLVTSESKHVCYLSSEFLVGRSLGLALVNLGLYDTARELLRERGLDIGDVLEQEHDPGLGNGGLGRLAACFMDSMATLELPAIGYGIRYDFGIFEQQIVDGRQVERRDDWLQRGSALYMERLELSQFAQFGGRVESHVDENGNLRMTWVATQKVVGVPYDTFIVGHQTNTVGTLRLWSARATQDFNLGMFNDGDYLSAVADKIESENISKVLYPSDHTAAGKRLRLRQQYFFVACSVADVIRRYKRRGHKTLDALPERVVLQLNDTHPSITVAELMRVLVDLEGLGWDHAWSITQRTLAYTNHTLLPEALEKWPVSMFEELLPRHLQIIYEINRRFLKAVHVHWPGDDARLARMSLIEEGDHKQVRMAHLATVGSFSVNGVAELHTQLLKEELLRDFYELWPERFNNQTNGVTPRRWLLNCNPGLANLITKHLGDAWSKRDFGQIKQLRRYVDNAPLLQALGQVKRENKQRLARLVLQRTGVKLEVDSLFVVQIKRFHEYKRQLLTLLGVISLYSELKRSGARLAVPRTYIFAGKAAAGYKQAKQHIHLINDVADIINNDPAIGNALRVVFVPNYGVSLAEAIIPAADISVQISLAGKEASGTGNMKFAMNGALTLGTLDGANVEIRQEVGPENFFLFGLTVPEVHELQAHGYRPEWFVERSARLRSAVELIENGFFSPGEPTRHSAVAQSLRHHDPFMVCADFDAFVDAEARAAQFYQDGSAWARSCLLNIAGSARFSSDETVSGYARDIWKIRPVPIEITQKNPRS